MVYVLFVAVVLGLGVAGCQRSQAPAPAPAAQTVGPLTTRLKVEGGELMGQQEYDKAALKFQAALNEAPNDIALRFLLAVALSYLPQRRTETVEHFTIVMHQGAPGSVEVKTARDWLANAGELDEGAAAAATTGAPASAAASARMGKVLGKIRWGDIEATNKMVRVNISLVGDGGETHDVRMGREFKIGRVYEFRDVPPGAYRLVAEVAGTTMWDLKVQVPAEKEIALDLTDSNASAPKDFTPPSD